MGDKTQEMKLRSYEQIGRLLSYALSLLKTNDGYVERRTLGMNMGTHGLAKHLTPCDKHELERLFKIIEKDTNGMINGEVVKNEKEGKTLYDSHGHTDATTHLSIGTVRALLHFEDIDALKEYSAKVQKMVAKLGKQRESIRKIEIWLDEVDENGFVYVRVNDGDEVFRTSGKSWHAFWDIINQKDVDSATNRATRNSFNSGKKNIIYSNTAYKRTKILKSELNRLVLGEGVTARKNSQLPKLYAKQKN